MGNRSQFKGLFVETWWERNRSWVLFWVAVTVLAGLLFAPALKERYVRSQRLAQAEEEARLREWPDISLPPIERVSTVFSLPDPPSPAKNPNDILDQRVDYMIDSYPDPEFARRARAAVDSRQVVISYEQIGDGLPAAFRIFNGTPVIAIDYREILERGDASRVLSNMLIFRHEFEHFAQAMATTDPVEMGTWTQSSKREQTPQECAFLWRHEFDAYRVECLDAVGMGFLEFHQGFCTPVVSDAAFKQRVFKRALASPGWMKRDGECAPTWAQLAGHPHPETFK